MKSTLQGGRELTPPAKMPALVAITASQRLLIQDRSAARQDRTHPEHWRFNPPPKARGGTAENLRPSRALFLTPLSLAAGPRVFAPRSRSEGRPLFLPPTFPRRYHSQRTQR